MREIIINIIATIILITLVGGGIYYIYKAKKNGNACIGCPHAKGCPSKEHNCNCSSENKK